MASITLKLADYTNVRSTNDLTTAYINGLNLTHWLNNWVRDRRKDGYIVVIQDCPQADKRIAMVRVSMYDAKQLIYLKMAFPT